MTSQEALLREGRAALEAGDLDTTARLLEEYRSQHSEDRPYDRNYLQLLHEHDIKQRRASRNQV